MGLDAADFHYLTILRELEKALSRLERRKPTSDRRQTYRTAAAFRTALPKLTAKGFGANIGVALQASAKVMAKTEAASAQVIRDLTEARPRLARLATGDWPPLVPAARMVERFTALTIGKHSEDPAGSLTEHAEESFRLAVLPALAQELVVAHPAGFTPETPSKRTLVPFESLYSATPCLKAKRMLVVEVRRSPPIAATMPVLVSPAAR